jgi:outer membrane receptor for ferrienterochelin and colicins
VRGPRLAAGLVLAAALPLAGQGSGAVYGVVRDSAGSPIGGVAVRVLQTGAATLTDSAGRYRITPVPPGPAILRAGRIGFFPAELRVMIPPGDSVAADFRLVANPLTVNPVIVTAAKRSQLLDHAVTSVAVVTEQRIAQRAVNTIDEAVDKAPGVQVVSGQINVRGSSGFAEGLGSRVLLLVDGVPANQGDRGGINWDIVPVDGVERVEVVKGAGSALYGSAAFGGVVNIITRDLPDGWHSRLRATTGIFANPPYDVWRFRSFTGIQDGLDLATSYGRGDVRGGISIGARHSDGYRQQDQEDHWQTTGQGAWRPDAVTTVRLSAAWASDQYQVPEPWCVATLPKRQCDDQGQSIQPFRMDTANAGNRTRSDKGFFSAVVTRTPSERLTWLARGSWLRTRFTDTYPNRNTPAGPLDHSLANRYGLEGRLVSHPDSSRVVTVGVEAAFSDDRSNIFSGDTTGANRTHTQGEYAAYGEAEQSFGPLRMTLGARGDFLLVDGGGVTAVVSPRVGAVWPTRAGAWRASVGRAFRAASLGERFATTFALGFPVVPNPALTPERGWSGEIGRSWTPYPWLRGDAAIFWTEARRLIEPTFTPAFTIQFQNVQRARLSGLDLSVSAEPFTPRLTTTLAYQYLHALELASDTSPQRPLLFRPRHLVTLTADYSLEHLAMGADFRFSSRYARADPIYHDPPIAAKVLDLRASWTTATVQIHLKIANALNYLYNLAPRVLEPVRTITLALTFVR